MHNRGDQTVATWLVSAGRSGEPGQPMNVPLVPASNFVLGAEQNYSRTDGTPTWVALESLVGGLEGGMAVAFASGMGAVSAVFEQLAVGSKIAIPADCYHGAAELAHAGEVNGRWRVLTLAVEDTAAWVAAAQNCDLLWLESPSNPLLVVADLKAICAVPRKAGGLLAVDNTLATPINQQPLKLGADFSVQSVTKFIGGHSDLLGGVVVAKTAEHRERLLDVRKKHGATPGALESYLAVRGARTMALRYERSQSTAMFLAEELEKNATIDRVYYPGLKSHPTHALAIEQLGGFGGVISFELSAGAPAADKFCRSLDLIQHATSFGGVESTLERRSAQPGQEHLAAGLIRMSVGIEDPGELWSDLKYALDLC
jgi:cystathionine gamma-synthase